MIKKYTKRLVRSLPIQMVIPVVAVICLLGAGLYFFVLQAVSEFADLQINEALKRTSSEVYDICDHNFTELMRSGQLYNNKAVRIKKALTIGAIEDYAGSNLIECQVHDNKQGEFLLEKIPPSLKAHLNSLNLKVLSSNIHFNGKSYYLSHFDFRPWGWSVDLIKDTAQYTPLIRRVNVAYIVTSILLLFSTIILLFILERLLRNPLNRIITAIRKGDSPDYKGIYEFEFLSSSIASMRKSLEERSKWIENFYHIAITNRGEAFFDHIANAISKALALDVLIVRFQRNDSSFHAVSFSQHENQNFKTLYPAEGLPCQQIVNENQPIVIPSGAYRHPLLANCIHNNNINIGSYLGLPINDHSGSVIGIINAFGKERSFSELDINLVETAGQMVASEFELLEKEKEKKQFQEQILRAQKLEGIGVLAGGIAHNFNNILMGIQGRVSLMLMDKDYSKPYFKHLKGIEKNVESAADLTKQLLGFARGGKYEVKLTDLNKLVERSVSMFGQTKKEISIQYNVQPGLWAVETDQNQIEQVLLNLFVNACQAMPEGGELSIQTQNVMLDESYTNLQNLKPGRYVKISVTDNGVGMDEITRQRVFDPFFTTKEIGRGTGLGLASAYGIVKNHGGIITVYSEKGHGSTFNIYLPASEKHVSEEKKTSEKISTGTGNILLVDDEDMILEVNKSMLEALGYKVLDVNSGEKAVKIYQKEKNNIDIVILDMIMPEMSGGKTFDRLKEINPDIKVILSSGYSLSGQAQEILDRGCSGFIQKPFNLNGLSRKIKEIMEKK